MKAQRIGALLDAVLWDEELMRQAPAVWELVVGYILVTGVDTKAFYHRVRALGDPTLRTSAMTIAQQLKAEGKAEGLAEGKAKGLVLARQDDVIEALELRFGKVPLRLRARVQALDDASRLRQLLKAAICCRDFEEFARAL